MVNGYKSPKEVYNEGVDFLKKIKSGKFTPLKTSLGAENEILGGGLYPTDQMILASRDGDLATAKIISMIDDFVNIDINPSFSDEIIILFNSWRNSLFRISLEFIARAAKAHSEDILRGRIPEAVIENLKESFYDKPVYVNDSILSVKNWYEQARKVCEDNPSKQIVVVTDNIRLVSRNNSYSEETLIQELLLAGTKLKNQFKTINIFIAPMSLKYEYECASKGMTMGNKLPTIDDIVSSSYINQASDIISILHNPYSFGLTRYDINLGQAGTFTYTTSPEFTIQAFVKVKFNSKKQNYIEIQKNGRVNQIRRESLIGQGSSF
jgi:hypothetical protein